MQGSPKEQVHQDPRLSLGSDLSENDHHLILSENYYHLTVACVKTNIEAVKQTNKQLKFKC